MFIKTFSNDDGMPKNKFTQKECVNFQKRVVFFDKTRNAEFVVTEVISDLNDNFRRIAEIAQNGSDQIVNLRILKRDLSDGYIKFINMIEEK